MRMVARDIVKSFGPTRALRGVSVTFEPGQIHALVGENGAGKSTLLKILAGAEPADAGTIALGDAAFRPRGLHEAAQRGVALVLQEITINPALSVAENVFIDRMGAFARLGVLARRRLERAAQAVLDEIGSGVSVRQPLDRLDVGKWKCIEIARALSRRPKVLLLDESTAFLDHREVDAVLAAMRSLRAQGLTVAFVSHHLSEVGAVADRLTILKDGTWVGDFAAGELAADEIHARMVGRDMSDRLFPPRLPRPPTPALLEVQALAAPPDLADVGFSLGTGEILGLAGLKGAGGERVLELLAGVSRPARGRMVLHGTPYAPRDPAEAWRAGIAYLPGDRTGEGLIAGFSVLANLVMPAPPRRGPFFDRAAARARADELIRRLSIRASSPMAATASLSGGNLQKVLLGKCVSVTPRLLLLNNPTRGVDVGARADIYRALRDLAQAGLAILLFSEDMPELLGLSDRLLVLRSGRIAAAFDAADRLEERQVVAQMI